VIAALNEARGKAVATNREHRVLFDLENATMTITQGDRAFASMSWPVTVKGPVSFPRSVGITRTLAKFPDEDEQENIQTTGSVTIKFSPNGTANSYITNDTNITDHIRINDNTGNTRFTVRIGSNVTGRIVLDTCK
jgi:hypothetical protein